MRRHSLLPMILAILVLTLCQVLSTSLPAVNYQRRQNAEPYFPDTPQSCQICAPVYPNISSCAASAYLFQNFTEIMFMPSGFIDVIKCSCTDTFESYFPQCVDCFIQTNQTDVLNSTNLPSLVSGMRQVCAFASTLFGGVASADGQIPSTSGAAPIQTAPASSSAARRRHTVLIPVGSSPGLEVLTTFILLAGITFGAIVVL